MQCFIVANIPAGSHIEMTEVNNNKRERKTIGNVCLSRTVITINNNSDVWYHKIHGLVIVEVGSYGISLEPQ